MKGPPSWEQGGREDRRACRQGGALTDLLVRRWSTAMPMVSAIFLEMPASLSSSTLKPRPRRTLELYCKK